MVFFNDSKFNMWRACIAIIWVDNKLDDAEYEWMHEKIEKLPFTSEQQEILWADLKAGSTDFYAVIKNVTDKKDRAFLAHQIRVIAHLDKDFSAEEKELLNSWNKVVLEGLDLVALEEQIKADEEASYHEDEAFKVNNKSSLFENALKTFQRWNNSGDYKFPKK